ncbi:rhodanese-like domain-containing protein [Achromobacter aloeverae]
MTNNVYMNVEPAVLKAWLHDGGEIALLDVREHGRFGEAHLFYAANTPYSRLEFEVRRLVPRMSARVVVYGEDSEDAAKAARALAALGYSDVHVLEGGVTAWKEQGYALFAGVNLPSKTFGELAEHEYHTPAMSAAELKRRIGAGENLVVLDGRPYAEYQKMSIPTAICCPNGELALHVQDLAPDESTTIVVNCAGRTRSIIGAQTLINLGVKNPVYALENGTQGWFLNDYALDAGQTRRHAASASGEGLAKARERASELARRLGVQTIDAEACRRMCADAARTTYLFDVRTPEEYRAGTYAGALHAPGGQLIQATDQYAATRGARLVLIDSEGVRAPTVAGWLLQLGWDVYVLDTGGAELNAPPAAAAPLASGLPKIDAAKLRELRDQGALLIDVRPSMDYRKQHIEGARWSIRELASALDVGDCRHVVLLTDDERVAELYAKDLRVPQGATLSIAAGDAASWKAAGLPLVATPDTPSDAECIDFLFFVHDRHSGNKAAAMKYLEWETNLVNQIDDRERASYRFLSH